MLIMLKKKNLFNAPLMALCYQTVLTLLPSSKTSRLQNKEECEIFLVKMSFIISMKMKKKKKHFSYQWLLTHLRFETEAWRIDDWSMIDGYITIIDS